MSPVKTLIRNKGSRDIENHCGYLTSLVFAKFLDLAKTKGSNLSPSLSPDLVLVKRVPWLVFTKGQRLSQVLSLTVGFDLRLLSQLGYVLHLYSQKVT